LVRRKSRQPPASETWRPNCEMSRAVGPLRVARQHGPHWRTASGQPPTKSQLLRGFDVNKSLKQKTGATPGQCYRRPPGRGMGSSKHFRFVLQWRQPFLSVSLLKPFGSGSLPASGTLQDGHGIPAPPHRRVCAPFQIQSWWSSGRYGSFINRRGDAADNSRALPRPRNRD
jgi:hypothetical protein